MTVKKIMCCCGTGVGSSLMVRLNVEKVLKQMGRTGISVVHARTSEAIPGAADIYVVGGDLAAHVGELPNKIVLRNIMSMNELQDKLTEMLEKVEKEENGPVL